MRFAGAVISGGVAAMTLRKIASGNGASVGYQITIANSGPAKAG
jgi:hypothetical protein